MKTEEITLLGKTTDYVQHYTADLLEALPRSRGRKEIELSQAVLPFSGFDLWTGFELSWLNEKGKPRVAIAEFTVPASSENLIESKSFKLYLNSFNQTQFASVATVAEVLERDLSRVARGAVRVTLYPDFEGYPTQLSTLPGQNIDGLDITISDYNFKPEYLLHATQEPQVTEILSSNLLKSNCLVTHQPYFGSVIIHYSGKKINQEQLLRYLISFRSHNEFHEQCVERIFADILQYCQPEKLSVFARYTRRGGLDINPFRSNFEQQLPITRLLRQ